MSDMTHKMWSQWKDFRLNEKKGDHEGQMAKSQLKRSVKLARMNYEIIDGMKKAASFSNLSAGFDTMGAALKGDFSGISMKNMTQGPTAEGGTA